MNWFCIYIVFLYLYYETNIHQGIFVRAQEPEPMNPKKEDPMNPNQIQPVNPSKDHSRNANEPEKGIPTPTAIDKNVKDVVTRDPIEEYTTKRKKTLNTRATKRVSYHTITVLNRTVDPYSFKEVKEKMCFLRPQRGPCRASLRMYYFHPTTMRCQKFQWGGCQGNGNRFDTRAECRKTCVRHSDDVMPRPYHCTLAYDYGYCFGSTKRYYYDRITELCKAVIYSGCGGNDNNFVSKAECEEECMLSFARNPRKIPKQFITS